MLIAPYVASLASYTFVNGAAWKKLALPPPQQVHPAGGVCARSPTVASAWLAGTSGSSGFTGKKGR